MTVAVLRKELVELTGDPVSALILNQLMYCAEHCARAEGWFYKASNQLASELFGLASASTVRRRIRAMVQDGYLEEDSSQGSKWDRTIWYRITDKLRALKKFAFRHHADSSKHSDSSSSHSDGSITKSALEGSQAHLQENSTRAIALVVPPAKACEKPTNQQRQPAFRVNAHAGSQSPHASRASTPAPASLATVYDGKNRESTFSKKSTEILQLQKIVQALAAKKGVDFKSEVKPLPRNTSTLEASIEEVGGYEQATKYLTWALGKSREYIANFRWKDFDLYLLLCKGLVKQWRIESGEVMKSGQVGFEDLLISRLKRDEYTFDPEDKEVGW